MKSVAEIARDCGMTAGHASLMAGVLARPVNPDPVLGALGQMDAIVGALYRRIEKLESEKQSVIDEAKDAQVALNGDSSDAEHDALYSLVWLILPEGASNV